MIDILDKKELPQGWAWTTVGEISQIKGGKRLPKGHTYSDSDIPTKYPYLRVTDFDKMGINQDDLKYLLPDTQKAIKNYTISKDDIYISIAGSIGKSGLIPDKLDGANLTENAAKITEIQGYDKKFLCYILNSLFVQEQINRLTISSNQPKLALFRIEKIQIPIAPLNEQDRIIKKIEELFTELDAGINNLNKIKAQLKRYRQAVLKHAFEGKLTAEWRQANKHKLEQASVLLEKIEEERKKQFGKKYKESPIIDASELPELPDGWEWAKLGLVADKISDGTHHSPKIQYNEPAKGRFLYVTSKNIKTYGVDLSDITYIDEDIHKSIYSRCNPEYGDLLLIKDGAITGRSTINGLKEEFSLLSSVALLKFNQEFILPKFANHFISSPLGQKFILGDISGVAITRTNLEKINNTMIPVMSLKEQEKIIEEVEKHLSVADQVEKVINQSLKQASRLRQSILKQAFDGKLVPQDPNDEPASVLLEKIKTEKEKQNGKKKVKV